MSREDFEILKANASEFNVVLCIHDCTRKIQMSKLFSMTYDQFFEIAHFILGNLLLF